MALRDAGIRIATAGALAVAVAAATQALALPRGHAGAGEQMMDIPESMKTELAAWNNGAGIDLESWVGCEGNFRLAVGYATVFWPEFVEFEGFILRAGFRTKYLQGFRSDGVRNHLLADGQ